MAICFCTLAIHQIYRERARLLCEDLAPAPVVILTDEPSDFADLPVRAIRHLPTGPMAADYLARLPATGNNRGAAAYHDKRFAIEAALENHETAIFLDADSRVIKNGPFLAEIGPFPPGIAVTTVVRNTIANHLEIAGSWRRPVFLELAHALFGNDAALEEAKWCHEACFAVTKEGGEKRFLAAWSQAAELFQERGVYSGEGGVIGLAAAAAGWKVDYDALVSFAATVQHEGGGPKNSVDTL